MRKLLLPSLLLWLLLSCGSPTASPSSSQSSFPLKESAAVPMHNVIEGLAVSDGWFVAQTPGELTAVDAQTQEPLWTREFSSITGKYSDFRIIDGVLATASEDEILLLRQSGSQKKINLDPTGERIERLVVVYPEYLFVIRGPKWTLEAYDVAKNKLAWKAPAGRGGADVYYDKANGLAYLVTRDYGISAVQGSSGIQLWRLDRSVLQSAFQEGILYTYERSVGGDKYRFAAIDLSSQQELWRRDVVAPSSAKVNMLQILDDLLIAGTQEGLIAIDIHTGNEVWHILEDEQFYSKPVEVNGLAYAKGASGKVYAIDLARGVVTGSLGLGNRPQLIQPAYEALAGVYQFDDGIMFNTKDMVVSYGPK